MKKIFLAVLSFACIGIVSAQQDTTLPKKKQPVNFDFNRPGDHFMIQLSKDFLNNAPDSISSHVRATSRGLNIYLMIDKPFRTDPHWSIAFGVGIGSSNILFKNMSVDIKATGTQVLPFINLDSADHFKKYKLSTNFLDVPVELRYLVTPSKEDKSWKIAIGAKVGTMLNAHTKGKNLESKDGAVINSYTAKESTKRFFNTTRLVATARVGVGHFSLFGAYTLTNFLKDGSGAEMKPVQIGLCLSGL